LLRVENDTQKSCIIPGFIAWKFGDKGCMKLNCPNHNHTTIVA